jgi:hypothetical protein
VRAVVRDPREVDELRGEQGLEAVTLAELVRLAREPAEFLTVQVGLGIDDEKRALENNIVHGSLSSVHRKIEMEAIWLYL